MTRLYQLSITGYLLYLTSVFCYGQTGAIIQTERSSPNGIVSFTTSSPLSGVGSNKHVDGYVRKYGNGLFTFPVGHKGAYRPFLAEVDGTTGAYFKENATTVSIPAEGPFPVASKQSEVRTVSATEFWDINGVKATRLTLTWDASSDVASLTNSSLPLLSIVGWNSSTSKWERITSTIDEISYTKSPSTLSSGSITTTESIIPNTYKIYTLAALSSPSLPVNYAGALETITCSEAKGWVWDQNYPDGALTVELVEGGNVYGTVTAEVYREDLENNGTGTGKYGFTLPIPASLLNGQSHQISIRVRGSTYALAGSPKALNCTFGGQLEVVNCSEIKGWGWNQNLPSSAVTVQLSDDSTIYASVIANTYRADLKNAGTGTGNYGFSFATPSALRDGKTRQLSMKLKDIDYTLTGSPQSLTCVSSQYVGRLELADCNFIKGWVWDKSYPDEALVIELVEGNKIYAITTANTYRQSLKDAGIGTGKYSFSIVTPAILKDGKAHALSIRVRGTGFVLTDSPKTVTCSPNDYEGRLETATCDVVKGWAWDKNNPDSTVTLELLEGDSILATTTADIYRESLKTAGIGTGIYGFSLSLPTQLKDGQPHDISIRAKGSGYLLLGSPKSITCAVPSSYAGVLEQADCNVVQGWAWDQNYPNDSVTVELLEGGVVRATVVASTYRADLKNAGTGTGRYGFSIAIPAVLKDGQAHHLSARVKGTSYVLGGSPKTVSCSLPPLYAGTFESADCNFVKGWAWDKNYPDSTLTLEIMEGSTVRGTVRAGDYREVLKTNGIGDGYHSFSLPLPLSLRDGQPHAISVRIKGTSYVLKGSPSPKTVTCAMPSSYTGVFEKADCNVLEGWVWDQNYPNDSFTVELLEGSVVRATVVAGSYRADLKNAGTGTGRYGFSIAIPAVLKDGQAHQLSARVRGTSYVLGGSPRTVSCSLPPLYAGTFESADCNFVKGWAWDKNYPDSTLTLEIMEGTTVRGTVRAGDYREVLKTNGIGDGYHSFSLPLPLSLRDGQPHAISVRIKGTSYVLKGSPSPKTVTCAMPSSYTGVFEKADCNVLEGWVWDQNYPNDSLTVEIVEGGVVRATVVAGTYRADLKNAGTGTGRYGFSIAIPAVLKDGQAHQLSARVRGTSYVLGGSPRTVSCSLPPLYAGTFESADCNFVKGWAWDKNYPDSTLTLEIMEGSTVRGTVRAGDYREVLKTNGIGDGYHSFSLPLPLSLRDGQPHAIIVRIKGTSYVLKGSPSPKTVNCAMPSSYTGVFEKADCNVLEGWVWDQNYPNDSLTVEIVEGGVVRATVVAGTYRADLKNAGTGTGRYGFSIAIPAVLKDGQPHQLSVRVRGTSYVLGGSPRTVSCSLPPLYAGTFESADCNFVKGWAWDKNYPDSTLTLEIMEGSTVRGTVRAGDFREVLKTNGIGDGYHSFSLPLPLSLRDGQPHAISVRIKGTSYVLKGTPSPKTVTCAMPSSYTGVFEKADCNVLEGWVWDQNYPNDSFTVEIVEGSLVRATVVASTYRADLKNAGTGTGRYGFSIALPAIFKDGQPHQLSVRIRGTSYVLGGSPKTVSCSLPPLYAGTFESADCNFVKGWAWDKNYPDSTLTLEIMEGSTVRGTVRAGDYREVLKTNGIGDGYHSFSLPLPLSLRDGQPHAISVRIKGTSYVLKGSPSPKTVTCAMPSSYTGVFEKADCNVLEGWVWDQNYPNDSFTVELLEGSVVRATVVAGSYRADLKNAGTGTGRYGFSIAIPAVLKDGQAHQLSARVRGTSYVLGGSPRTVSCSLPPLYAGTFESADCNFVKGWAWDKNYPDSTLTLEIMEGTTVRGTVRAGDYREVLKTNGIGDGYHSFSLPLPLSLRDGQPHAISVRIKGTSYVLKGNPSPKTVNCVPPSSLYSGVFEKADCNVLEGWVWDQNYPNDSLTVEIVEGGVVRATVVSGTYRADLKNAGTGTGRYGFSIALPASLKDGQAHQLSARVKGTTYILSGSGTVNCAALPPLYAGTFEKADCNEVRGWTWDKSYPDSVLTVEIIEGTTVRGSARAGDYREILKTNGVGTGYHSFSFPLPSSLKDGKPHAISIRIKGTSYVLKGSPSPKTVTCASNARLSNSDETEIESIKDEVIVAHPMVVSPNPTTGPLSVDFGLNEQEQATIVVLNVTGRILWKESVIGKGGKFQQKVDLSQYPGGVYLVQLQRKNKAAETKTIVLTK